MLATAFIAATALLFLPAPGTGDVSQSSLPWMQVLGEQGLVDGYAAIGADYPPLSHLLLWLAQLASLASGVAPFVVFKLMLLAFGLVATLVLFIWKGAPVSLVILFLVWGINAMALGYLDVIYLPFLLGALWALERDRPGLAGALLAVACLIKWQPIIIAPFLVVHAWRSPRLAVRAALPGLVVVTATYALFGYPMLDAFRQSISHDVISANAVNMQWLVTGALEYLQIAGHALDEEGGIHYVTGVLEMPWVLWPAKLLLAAIYLWVLLAFALSRRDFSTMLCCSMTAFLTYFVVNTGVHENHLFVPATLGTLLILSAPAWTTLVALVILLNNVNMIAFYGLNGSGMYFSKTFAGFDATVPLAILSIVLLVFFLLAVPRPRLRSSDTETAGTLAQPQSALSFTLGYSRLSR
jgi:Gpi18-like mannosyltransferase